MVRKRAPKGVMRAAAAWRIAAEPSRASTVTSGCAARIASDSRPSPQQRSITSVAAESRGTSASTIATCRALCGT